MDHERYMRMAIAQAEKAAAAGEIPVGAVVVCGDTVLSAACNDREATHSPLGHAEVRAIEAACRVRGDWRLEDCTLYVTVEPCVMCAGAIGWAQVGTIVYGAADEKRGYSRFAPKAFHPKAQVKRGILEAECADEMRRFFQSRR